MNTKFNEELPKYNELLNQILDFNGSEYSSLVEAMNIDAELEHEIYKAYLNDEISEYQFEMLLNTGGFRKHK